MPVLWTLTSTSSGPISGFGTSRSHRPGAGFSLTRAFMRLLLGQWQASAWHRRLRPILRLLPTAYCRTAAFTIPTALPASAKAATAKSTSVSLSAADIWVRMRAAPFGTTGKKKPAT